MAWISITQHYHTGIRVPLNLFAYHLFDSGFPIFFFQQVLDVPPVQCYAFTQGHVISVADSLDKVAQSGRYLLYKNRRQSFEVQTKVNCKFRWFSKLNKMCSHFRFGRNINHVIPVERMLCAYVRLKFVLHPVMKLS